MPKQIAVTVMEGTRRRGRPGKTWRGEVEEDVNGTGVTKRQAMARTRREWRKGDWEAKVHTRAIAIERLRGRSTRILLLLLLLLILLLLLLIIIIINIRYFRMDC